MDSNEKKIELDGEKISVMELVARLAVNDKDKDLLCLCLGLATSIGYETGFKAAMAINTGLHLDDPKLIKLIKDMEPASTLDEARLAGQYRTGLKMILESKKKEEVNKNA